MSLCVWFQFERAANGAWQLPRHARARSRSRHSEIADETSGWVERPAAVREQPAAQDEL
jgi:hypothetical protein